MTPSVYTRRYVGVLLYLLGMALNAGGCGGNEIAIRKMWSCPGSDSGQGRGGEDPVSVMSDVGVLTRTSQHDGNKEVATFRVRSLASGAIISQFVVDGPSVHVGIDSNGRYVATCRGLWDAQTGKKMAEFANPAGHNGMCLAVGLGGGTVLSAGDNGDVLLYKVGNQPTSNPVQPLLLGHTAAWPAQYVSFSPDGKRALAAGLGTQSWLIWETEKWGPPTCVLWKNPPESGSLDASWKGFFGISTLVDWDTGSTICRIKRPGHGRVMETHLLPDKQGILAYWQSDRIDSYRDHALYLFRLSGVLVATKPLSASVWPVAFSPEGQYMITRDLVPATASYPGLEVLDKDALGSIRCWRVEVK